MRLQGDANTNNNGGGGKGAGALNFLSQAAGILAPQGGGRPEGPCNTNCYISHPFNANRRTACIHDCYNMANPIFYPEPRRRIGIGEIALGIGAIVGIGLLIKKSKK